MSTKRLILILSIVTVILSIVGAALISTLILRMHVGVPVVTTTVTAEAGPTTIFMPTTITATKTSYITVTERVTENIIERITETSTTTVTVTKTITKVTTQTTTITVVPVVPPCPYRELFNRSVSNIEGRTILVWSGNINCHGVLTVITGGCWVESWYIRIINDGRDSGWIKVPCTCECNNFKVVPGKLEVWVGWCIREGVCPLIVDRIDIEGILGEGMIECFCLR